MSGLFDAELFTVGCLITDGTSHPNPDVVFSEIQSHSNKVLWWAKLIYGLTGGLFVMKQNLRGFGWFGSNWKFIISCVTEF